MILLRINSKGIDLPTVEALPEAKLVLTKMQHKNKDKRGKLFFFILFATPLLEDVFTTEGVVKDLVNFIRSACPD